MGEYVLGPVTVIIEHRQAKFKLAPQSARHMVEQASGILARITTDDGAVLTAGLAFFERAEPHITGLELVRGDERYARATTAGSVSVKRLVDGQLGMALQLLKFGAKERPTLHGTSWAEIDDLLGFGIEAYLTGLGANALGYGGELLGYEGKTKNVPACVVPAEKAEVLLVAWTATRVLPLLYRYGRAQAQGVLS